MEQACHLVELSVDVLLTSWIAIPLHYSYQNSDHTMGPTKGLRRLKFWWHIVVFSFLALEWQSI